jgi:light-regulated signal transduction histidine kinase (bacteriophytochrome)
MAGPTQSLHEQRQDDGSIASAESQRIRELERELAARTEELAAARRELDAFTYSVAHDLRAPLRLIHAHIQMLLELPETTNARQPKIHLEQIQRGAKHMSALIDGILTLSRLGHVELDCRTVRLDELADQVCQKTRAENAARDVECRVDPLPPVCCDSQLMAQVLENLIGNAFKFSAPRRHALIHIGAESNGEARFFVRDNGVGFDMRYAGKLFGAFQRLHRQDEFEGVGIGLAASRRIIERHGGRIWAEAEVDKGAAFWFTLGGSG